MTSHGIPVGRLFTSHVFPAEVTARDDDRYDSTSCNNDPNQLELGEGIMRRIRNATSHGIPVRRYTGSPPGSSRATTSLPVVAETCTLTAGTCRWAGPTVSDAGRQCAVRGVAASRSGLRLAGTGRSGCVSTSSRACSSSLQRRQQQHTACL